MTQRRVWLGALAAATLLAGIVTGTASSASTTNAPPSEKDWQAQVSQAARPTNGCYKTEYPKVAWQATACATPPAYPQVPKVGPRPMIVGNGSDVSALTPGGAITSAVGSFDTASVASESGQNGGAGPMVANSYSLQLNTNFFNGSPACGGSSNPALCQAWEQFIFSNDGTSGVAFIQYWLLNYNNPCAAGWFTYMVGPATYCYRNSPSGVGVPVQSATTLANQKVAGNTTATTDGVTMFVGLTGYTVAGSNAVSLNASGGWTEAEFNVFGNGGGSMATFNAGAALTVRTRINYGGVLPPICVAHGFTGETNNLNFALPAPSVTGPGPALKFVEDTVGGAAMNCDSATGVGDVHETTTAGLKYDFQGRGDYETLQSGPNFEIQSRHLSGAPSWPQASVNQAIATRMGTSRVVVCVGPKLVIDGKPTQLTDGRTISLPTGVDIHLVGGVYVITDQDGNSVSITPRSASPNYLDLKVGMGTWPTTVRGLLGNPNNDVNYLEARDGTVFPVPLSFQDLYQKFGDSWRVKPFESMLNVCGSPSEVGSPTKPFHTTDLPPQVRERAQAVCAQFKITQAWLDACVLDVAVLGEKAAAVYVGMAPPVRDADRE